MEKKIRKWVLPPCPSYDVEGTESWLTDMASEGWMLSEDGFFLGGALFEKREPDRILYRLEAALRRAGAWDDQGGGPDEEAATLNAAHGWEYAARRGQFYIYRSASESAREINTDPQVQALAIREVQKRQTSSVWLSVYWLIVYPLLRLWRGSLVWAIAEGGLGILLGYVILPAWILISEFAAVMHLHRLKKKLQAGEPLNHGKDWKKGRYRYYGRILMVILQVFLIVLLIGRAWNLQVEHSGRMQRSEYSGAILFATMADFAEGSYEQTWHDLQFDYVEPWSNAFLKRGIHWVEHAQIRRTDGTALDGGLYVDYCETRWEWFAKALSAAYVRLDRNKALGNYLPLECPDFGLDEVTAYRNDLHFPCVVLRRGNVVIHAFFYQTGENAEIPLDQWAGKLADSIS